MARRRPAFLLPLVLALLALAPAVFAQDRVKTVAAVGFTASTTDITYSQTLFLRYATAGPVDSRSFDASLELPEGAKVTGLELDGCNMADDTLVAYLVQADSTGAFTPYPDINGVVIAPGAGCMRNSTAFAGPTYDPITYSYFLRVYTPHGDATQGFRAVRVFYQLQVGPAPAVATFNDVPTSDPAFQFIEALVAAGITAGCGNSNYCPDNFVTRRQMAVFISKGLGLGWQTAN